MNLLSAKLFRFVVISNLNDSNSSVGTSLTYNGPFLEQTGLTYVRGCEVEGMLDQNGKVIEEGPDPKPELSGDTRTYRVFLDQNQYQVDMDNVTSGQEVRELLIFF